MSREDIITLPKLIKGVVKQLPHIRSSVKGMLIATNKSQDKPLGLGLMLEEAAASNPKGVAVSYEKKRINYADFNGWVNQLALHFSTVGLEKGDSAVVFLENRPELLAVCAAFAKLGVASIMINTSQTGSVLLHSLQLVKASAYVVGNECAEQFEAVRKELKPRAKTVYGVADGERRDHIGAKRSAYRDLDQEIKGLPRKNPQSTQDIRPSDHCFYIFTSGTTGLPKASVISHGKWMKAYGGFGLSALRLTPSDSLYVTLPFYHATALVVCWSCVLSGKATIAMGRRFSATNFWKEAKSHKATAIGYVGELCRYLINQPKRLEDRNNKVTKMIGNGLRPAIWKDFKSRFGVEQVVELYGSSEGNIGFTNLFNFDNTVGFSPVNYALVKFDKETGQPLRNSKGFMEKVGKHGTGLMLGKIDELTPFDGYTNAENSQKAIYHDVFEKGDAWFNSGDVLRDLGFHHAQFVDRLGDTFRWKGENVSTTELEGVVSGFESVSECVAYGVEIPDTNGKAGMITITLTEGAELDGQALKNYLTEKLPHYAVPVFLRVTESFDTTGTFKYQKSDLKKQAYDPNLTTDPLWVLLPDEASYQTLDETVFSAIQSGQYRY